jgi:hypothetical protein
MRIEPASFLKSKIVFIPTAKVAGKASATFAVLHGCPQTPVEHAFGEKGTFRKKLNLRDAPNGKSLTTRSKHQLKLMMQAQAGILQTVGFVQSRGYAFALLCIVVKQTD